MYAPRFALAILLSLTLGSVGWLTGCAKDRPDLTPALTFTVRATQVTEGTRAALPGLKGMTCQTLEQQKASPRLCLTPNEVDVVAGHIERGFRHAQDAARIAPIVDKAQTEAERADAMGKLSIVAKALQESLLAATIAPEFEPGRQAVVKLLSSVLGLLMAFTPITPV